MPAPSPDRTRPPSGREELIDARRAPEGAPERIVAEWLPDERGPGNTPAGGALARRELERAAASAQQAIDDRAVSPRYHALIERYFRRLPERVLPAGPPAGAAPDAETRR